MCEEELVSKLLQIRNRNWVQDQIKLHTEQNNSSSASLDSLLISRRVVQLREQFVWLVWAIAQYYFLGKHENKFGLPKTGVKRWTEGFEFKGVFIKVLPYEDAYYLRNELQALKYVQLELLELTSLSAPLSQQHQVKETLHKDVLLPLITGVAFNGFYLYGTPVIYTQELDSNNRADVNRTVSVHNSVQMQAVASNMSFSYLHNNINAEFIQDSMFKFMPILKNLSTKNMIPIIDFEEYQEAPSAIELKYFLLNMFDMLPRLSESSASTCLMRIPVFKNEEITFHPFPKSNHMEYQVLKQMISCEGEAEEDSFSKKFFSKHGWDFIMMYGKKEGNEGDENKRASGVYGQREIGLRKAQKDTDNNNNAPIMCIDDYAL